LSLSDSSVLSLTGQPMWFTVCPLDPNLPPLPKPVHHKQQLSPSSQKRQSSGALSRLVQKAHAITSSTASPSSVRQSVTLTEGFHYFGTAKKPSPKSSPRHSRKAKSGHFDGGNILGLLEGTDVGSLPATRHTLNEAKLAKLSSIITVLRQSVGEDTGEDTGGNIAATAGNDAAAGRNQNKRESTPEFLKMFEEQGKEGEKVKDDHIQLENPPNDSDKKKAKRKSRPPRTMLKAVREDGANNCRTSDSGEPGDTPPASENPTLNQQSLEWLASRKMSSGEDSNLQQIPILRESLHGSRPNRVNHYMFESLSSETKRSLASEFKNRPFSESTEVTSGLHQQLHYKLVDTRVQGETEEKTYQEPHKKGVTVTTLKNAPRPLSLPASHTVSSPECKCYHVPVEVSVHRISVVDVDRQEEQAKADIARTRSVDTRPPGAWSKKDGSSQAAMERSLLSSSQAAGDEMAAGRFSGGVMLRAPVSSGSIRKSRSRSMGDVELLSSDEEVLLVRAPPRSELKEACLDTPTDRQSFSMYGGDTLGCSSSGKKGGELAPPHRILEPESSQNYRTTSIPCDLANSDVMSSLDRISKPSSNRQSQPSEEDTPPSSMPTVVLRRAKVSQRAKVPLSSPDMLGVKVTSKRSSWMERDTPDKQHEGKMTKYRSMDNLVDTVEAEGKRK